MPPCLRPCFPCALSSPNQQACLWAWLPGGCLPQTHLIWIYSSRPLQMLQFEIGLSAFLWSLACYLAPLLPPILLDFLLCSSLCWIHSDFFCLGRDLDFPWPEGYAFLISFITVLLFPAHAPTPTHPCLHCTHLTSKNCPVLSSVKYF